jgi:hypothetical protein
MTKTEMTTPLRSVGVNENTITAMENAYELGVESGRETYMQLFLDPENQPTQFGTATQEYREQEIKDEREACAKVCEELHPGLATNVAAQYIRNRGEA